MKKQESKEYQEAAEILAKKLCVLDSNEWGLLPNFYREDYIFKVRKLLQETYPCKKCGGYGYPSAIPPHGNLLTPRGTCPDCKGTCQGGKVLAVRARNQTWTDIHGDMAGEAMMHLETKTIALDSLKKAHYELANQIHKECKDWKYIIELNRIITWLGSVPAEIYPLEVKE